MLAEFNAASSASIAPLKMYRSLWVAPSPHPHQFKVNFNAAMTPGSEGIGISVVIRRAHGEFFVGLSKFSEVCYLVETVELKVWLEALRFAIDTRFSDIILEGDDNVC